MPLKNPLSHDQRKTLAKCVRALVSYSSNSRFRFVDTNQNGHIDIKEFTAAFKVTHVRPDAWRAVVDRLMEVRDLL